MLSGLRPNYRRARALALEMEALSTTLEEYEADPSVTSEQIEDLKAELQHLQREFFLTGVSSEYEL